MPILLLLALVLMPKDIEHTFLSSPRETFGNQIACSEESKKFAVDGRVGEKRLSFLLASPAKGRERKCEEEM
jgi:hypothetical protein